MNSVKIILLQHVAGLGKKGEIKEVKEGYVLNYLIPKGLADFLTKQRLNIMAVQQKKQERAKNLNAAARQDLAAKINGKLFTIKVMADEAGTLYAKIDARVIFQELIKQYYGIKINDIELEQPIKKIGEHEIGMNIEGKKAKIKLIIAGAK